MFLSLDPIPKLVIDDIEYYGINILEKLCEMRDVDINANFALQTIANMHRRPNIPRIGFSVDHPNAIVPTKRDIDVGYDITIIGIAKKISPLTTLFETGISIITPLGYYTEMVPRSSLSKMGYVFANSIGVIDPAYTGTLKVALVKVDPNIPDIELPARVAQIILKPYVFSDSYVANAEDKITTTRGNGGFGSTG